MSEADQGQQPSLSDEILAGRLERFLSERSPAWEGKTAGQPLDLGDVFVRPEARRGGLVTRITLDPTRVEARLDELLHVIEGDGRRCLWVVGPSTRPADLGRHLLGRGFQQRFELLGLALTDLSAAIPTNPEVVVEPLSPDNAPAYASRCTPSTDPRVHAYLLESAQRYLAQPRHEVEILVARLRGEVAGYAVLRAEPTGLAFLCDAMTVPAFRRQGVYLSLLAHRLTLARAAGCVAAVTHAQVQSSAPILMKRGFRPISRVFGYSRPPAESNAAGGG
ncbi:MAG TPA: GNAT family N-acetyltransferase [Chloroflexota bacterium]